MSFREYHEREVENVNEKRKSVLDLIFEAIIFVNNLAKKKKIAPSINQLLKLIEKMIAEITAVLNTKRSSKLDINGRIARKKNEWIAAYAEVVTSRTNSLEELISWVNKEYDKLLK